MDAETTFSGKISLSSGAKNFVIECNPDPQIINSVRLLPNVFPGKGIYAGRWLVPFNMRSVDEIAKLYLENDFWLSPEIETHFRAIGKSPSVTDTHQKKGVDTLLVQGLGLQLRPYQIEAVQFALKNERVIIGDQMGIGKSGEALATLQAAGAFPSLIICPAILKINWEREIKKWLPGKSLFIVNGVNEILLPVVDLIVINYDILKYWYKQLNTIDFQGIIIDESHMIKEPKSERTILVTSLASQIKYRFALTGTPVINKPYDLIGQLNAIGRLEEFGGKKKFIDRYCGAKWIDNHHHRDTSGCTNLEELNAKLRESAYIRRTKNLVLPDLPEKQQTILYVNTSNDQSYNLLHSKLVEDLRALKSQTAKRGKAYQSTVLTILEKLRHAAAWEKVDRAVEWITEFIKTGEKLVIFAIHKDIIKEIIKRMKPLCRIECITGDTIPADRQEAIDCFQRDPNVQLLIMNIRAGGLGIDLTASSSVLFVELDWTAAAHEQAEDRCHRSGQNSPVNAWYLLAVGTIDEKIYHLIECKREMAGMTVDGRVDEINLSASLYLVNELTDQNES